jgi:hypothetical protein
LRCFLISEVQDIGAKIRIVKKYSVFENSETHVKKI